MWFISGDIFFLGIMSITIYLSLCLQNKHKLLRGLGSPGITFLIASILRTVGLVPSQHIFYSQIFTWGIPLALATSLISTEPFKNRRLGQVLTRSLFLGAALLLASGVFVGILLNFIGLPGYPEATLNEKLELFYTLITPKILSQAPREGYSLFAVLSNVLLPFGLLLGLLLPLFFKRWYPTVWFNLPMDDGKLYTMELHGQLSLSSNRFSLENLCLSLSLSLFTLAASEVISRRYPALPFLLLVGVFAFILGKLTPRRHLIPSADLICGLILHIFFFTAGTLFLDGEFLSLAGPIAILAFPLVIFQLLATLIIGRLLKADIETITVVFQAQLGGPYAAFATAVAKKWQPLYWVALICGIAIYGLLGLTRILIS